MAIASARPDLDSETYPAVQLRGLSGDLADLRQRLLGEHQVLPGDFEVLKALVDTPDATQDELAITAHASPAGFKAALDRLHAARLAKIRGFSRRAIASVQPGESAWWPEHPRGRAPEIALSLSPAEIRPVATGAGHELVAAVDAAMEAPLEAVLGTLPAHERHRLAGVLDAIRTQVWEVGAAPVVAVLVP